MNRAWMALYVGDFLLDTRDLSLEQQGAYLNLLMLAWRRPDVSLPNDDHWLRSNLPHMHGHTFNRVVRPVLERFFSVNENGNFVNKRLTKEKQTADKLSAKQKQKADKRWSRSKENKDLSDAAAMPSQSQSQSQSQKKEKKDIDGANAPPPKEKPRGSRLPEDWQPSPNDLNFATGEGVRADVVAREIQKFRDYWHSRAGPGAVKRDWSATWRNWIRSMLERGWNEQRGLGASEDKSASRAAGRLLDAHKRGEFVIGPRPSLLPEPSENVVRLLPERRSQ